MFAKVQLNNLIVFILTNSCYITGLSIADTGHLSLGRRLLKARHQSHIRAGVRPAQASQSHSVGVVIRNLSESHKNNKYSFCYGVSLTSVLCIGIFSILM